MVRRQIEFARSARNASALFDAHQPFIFAQMLAYFAVYTEQAVAGGFDLIEHGIQRFF